jgi:gliding motility-associated-like protein
LFTKEVNVIGYPKYFTPNGDGIHDTWNIIGLNQQGAKIHIYDRFGKLLKQITPNLINQGWDGTYFGSLMPSSDYWFTIEYKENNIQKLFKAHFTLKR